MTDINVYGDKRRVRQILLNLVGNAVKFTDKGHVRIDVYDSDPEEVTIAIRDTGIGMKKEDLAVIFERFRQADGSAKRAYEGTGLGLAITKEMVELQKGRIWVESELDKGTTIYFTLPKNPFDLEQDAATRTAMTSPSGETRRQEKLRSVPERAEESKKKARKGNGETILVVDDETINIEALSVALKSHNYSVLSAEDGFSGLKLLRAKKPRAVLLDVMMPGMDGFEFCKLVKEDDETSQIPILLLTAKATTADKIEGLDLGADDYIVKPFNSEELIARLQSAMRRSQTPANESSPSAPVSKVYELKQTEDSYKEIPRGSGEKILVIDDEPINIEVLERRLTMSNYVVLSALDGLIGLQMAEETRPDLIILDLMMPRMTGYEFCKEIRAREDLKDIPLIMLTGKDTTADKIYGYNLGADDYMTKPINKTDILMRVHALLRTKALQNQLKAFADRLADLFGVGINISSTLDAGSLHQIIAASAHRVMQAERSVLFLANARAGLSPRSHLGFPSSSPPSASLPIGSGPSGRVAETKRPLLISSIEHDSRFREDAYEPWCSGSVLSVPLIDQDVVVGVLTLARSSDSFTNEDLQILLILANQATIALRNVNLVEQERELTQRVTEAEVKAEYVDILHRKNEDLEEAYKQLKATQKQLVQSEKMATIGVLAGGVAHEINTPLGTILTNAEMLKLELTDEWHLDCLKLVESSTLHCRTIIQNLLNYSRTASDASEPVHVRAVLDETLALLKSDLSRNGVAVETEHTTDGRTQGNSNELKQVFTNLIVNAMHAIVSRHGVGGGDGKITLGVTEKDAHVSVLVQDNGCGIKEEHKTMIFDPFFTTKAVNEGTGLGLSVTYNIIQKHGGFIEVDSTEGEGTSLRVKLPLLPEEVEDVNG